MKNQKGGLSRFFGRTSAAKPRAADLTDLTSHLAIDLDAISSRPDEPAFMSPPPGAKPYHGFKLLPDVESEGFVLGAITDFLRFPALETGDGFVEAPDGTRSGLEWRMSTESYVLMMAAPTAPRWGVWLVGFTRSMDSIEAARLNLADIQPILEEKWRAWHAARLAGEFGDVSQEPAE